MTDYQLEFGIPRGPQGPQGPTGATGPIGPQGPVGPRGPPGADAVPPKFGTPVTGAPGSPVTLTGVGTTDDPIILSIPRGANGEAGPAGPKGEQGPAGPAGPAGQAGPAGPVGPAAATTFEQVSLGIGDLMTDESIFEDSFNKRPVTGYRDGKLGGAASYGNGGTLSRTVAPVIGSSSRKARRYYVMQLGVTNPQILAFLNTALGNADQITVVMTVACDGDILVQPGPKTEIEWRWNGEYLDPVGTTYCSPSTGTMMAFPVSSIRVKV